MALLFPDGNGGSANTFSSDGTRGSPELWVAHSILSPVSFYRFQRVEPRDFFESGKIGVVGVNDSIVFGGEFRDLGIGSEIACRPDDLIAGSSLTFVTPYQMTWRQEQHAFTYIGES